MKKLLLSMIQSYLKIRKLNNKGFTLMEILLVVAIIGIISVGGIVGFGHYKGTASAAVAKRQATQMLTAYRACRVTDTQTTCSDADINGALSTSCATNFNATAPTSGNCTVDAHGTDGSTCLTFAQDDKLYCFDVDSDGNVVNGGGNGEADKYCKTDGTCA